MDVADNVHVRLRTSCLARSLSAGSGTLSRRHRPARCSVYLCTLFLRVLHHALVVHLLLLVETPQCILCFLVRLLQLVL